MTKNTTTWAIQFKNGSEKAFESLYRHYSSDILNFLIYLTKNSEDANDISQEVWMKVIHKKDSLQKPELFKQWLYRIAKNTFINHFNNNKKEPISLAIDSIQITLEDESILIKNENKELVMNLISKLSNDKKTILWLRFNEEYSNNEIAKILNIPAGTVRTRLHYIIKELKKYSKMEIDK